MCVNFLAVPPCVLVVEYLHGYGETTIIVKSPILDTPKFRYPHYTGHRFMVQRYFLLIVPIHFEPPKEDNLLTQDERGSPKCPLFGDSTVVIHNLAKQLCSKLVRMADQKD